MPQARRAAQDMPLRLLEFLVQPTTQTDLLQIGKAVAAAVVAWLLAIQVGLSQPFLAPWAALLTVHATVYRSFWRGAQSVLATGLGIILSFVMAEMFGIGAATLAIVLLLCLVLARAGVLREEGVTMATTALFVLTTGYEHQQEALVDRFVDTAIGVAVGILVNLLVFPPLNDRSAQQQVDRIDRKLGNLLADMATQMRSTWSQEHSSAWIDRTRDMDNDLDHAWHLVRHSKESGWWNPRRRFSQSAGEPTQYESVLRRLEEGIAQARSLARVVHESTESAQEWDARFREPWLDILHETGLRVADPRADVELLHENLYNLAQEIAREGLPDRLWPTYGALITNLINVVDIVDDVASSLPVRTADVSTREPVAGSGTGAH
jgi:hypothetical protein